MNIAEFHFIRPYWLLAVLPYLLILVLMLRNKLSQGNWTAVCDAALLPYLLQEKAVNQSRWPITAGASAALIVILALAGPTWERLPSPVFRNDSALVIVLDLSLSMNAADIKPSRLIMARYKIADILKQRKDGQTALLVYAGDAFTVTPLTDDIETIDSQLSALTTEIMPSQGSNTALVLEKAVELFKQAGLQKGQILLVTDGVELDKTLATAKALDKYQLSVLGVGTADGAPIALPDGGFVKDQQGTIVVPKLNYGDLKTLAQAGNGLYQTITTNDADIQNLLVTVNKSVQQQGKENNDVLLDQWAEKGPWLLLLALPLAALTFRKGLLCFALLLMLPLPKNSYALGLQDLWQTKDQQAQQAYKKQDFATAAEKFENPDWKVAAQYKAGDYEKAVENLKTVSNAYNQGNVLAKAGKLEEAIKAYEKALSINPNDSDAKFNKELVEKELEKQKQEQKQDQKKDDKQQAKDDSQKNKEGDKKDSDQSEKSGDQQKSDEKPEQKPEQKQSDKQQSEENKQQDKDKAEQKKQEDSKIEQAEQNKEAAKKEPAKEQTPAEIKPSDEQQQANEQWLKRIPDDPAGLLKRKFKYQYGQRGRQANSNKGDW